MRKAKRQDEIHVCLGHVLTVAWKMGIATTTREDGEEPGSERANPDASRAPAVRGKPGTVSHSQRARQVSGCDATSLKPSGLQDNE